MLNSRIYTKYLSESRFCERSEQVLIIGLGNPGEKYKNTRHNVGFRVVDEFARENNFPEFRLSKKFNALISEREEIILVKPQTFMNNSGIVIKKIIQNSKATLRGVRFASSKIQNLLDYIEEVVKRYKNSPAIWAWQVENEPFFPFGICPEPDKELLKKEIDLVKYLDGGRPVIISESGEFPLWISAAKYGDIVGVTMYKKVWFEELNSYLYYPFPPIFYWRKAQLIKRIFNKEVICVELQAEPWGPKLVYDLSLAEQEKTMNLERFQKNIEFAKKTGLKEFYLWGAEWMYWLKEKQNKPEIWQEAKKLF